MGRGFPKPCIPSRSWFAAGGSPFPCFPHSSLLLLIRQRLLDGASSDASEDGVGALVVGQGDQPDREGPAATSRPRCVINPERGTEDGSALG